MADQHHLQPMLHMTDDLAVHLGYQRAGGIDHPQPHRAPFAHHRAAHPMGGEDRYRPLGHLMQFIDKHRAHGAQAIDHMAVMDDLVANIDRRAEPRQRLLHDRNRPIHTGAEAARTGQHNALGAFRHQPSAWAACSASTSRAKSSLYSAITPIKINE